MEPAGGGTTQKLAANQTLRFPLLAGTTVSMLDPAHVNGAQNISFTTEMFAGVLTMNDRHQLVPLIGSALPDVSADGLTYTFHLRSDATFWNGDRITSADVLYSWNRTAALQDSYAAYFQPVAGYQQVASGQARTLSGLTASDPHTVVAKLQYPAGYWETELALWPAMLVDRKAIEQGGANTWWSNPQTAVGAGPFRLVKYQPNESLDFEPVKHWWGGSTGTLTHIHVDEGVDGSSAVKKYEADGYDLIGPADQPVPNEDVLRYLNDPTKKAQLHLFDNSSTTWMGFNFTGGSPFAPRPGIAPGQPTVGLGVDQGKAGRQSFSLAINRNQLADVACVKGVTCSPATGGFMAPGLRGYVGNGKDPSAPAGGDAARAKAEYEKWDPTGSKLSGLKLEYNTTPTNDAVWQNVQAQLQASLGVHVQLEPNDFPTVIADRNAKKPYLFREAWGADFDHPQDWFSNNFMCSAARVGGNNAAGFCDPAMDTIVEQANQKPVDQVLTQYQRAGQDLINNNFGANLFYSKEPFLIQPYVVGAGYDGLSDDNWTEIKLLQH